MKAPTIKTVPRLTRRRRRKRRTLWHSIQWPLWTVVNVASYAALFYFYRTGLIGRVADAVRQSLGGF